MPLVALIARTRAFVRHWGPVGAVVRVWTIARQHGFPALGERLTRALTGRAGLVRPRPRFDLATHLDERRRAAMHWYARHAVPVVIVIPGVGDDPVMAECVLRIQRTTNPGLVTVATEDAGDGGVAAACKRGLARVPPGHDVVLLDPHTLPREAWLEALQHAARASAAGIVVPKLLDADGRIASAGPYRDIDTPTAFAPLYRSQVRDYPPSLQPQWSLGASADCLYLTAETLARLGALDDACLEDLAAVDYGLRAWRSGIRVRYQPTAELQRAETPGASAARSKAAADHFWAKNGGFFEREIGATAASRGRVIYVTQDLGIGGGHRVVFRHVNTLAAAGFDVALWNLQRRRPEWHPLDERIALRKFADYAKLTAALEGERAIKVATWWETAEPVWLASVRHGLPVYLVQDIESSYYADDPESAMAALASYRPEFNYLVTGAWIQNELAARFRFPAVNVRLGYDTTTFRPRPAPQRVGATKTVLVSARAEPLKNFAYARAILLELARHGYETHAFGADRSLVEGLPACRFHLNPSDAELAALYSEATLYLSTSTHEGFSLPPIEAMACGCVVAMTDAHGNRDYLDDRVNCLLLPSDDPAASARRIVDALNDPALVERLVANGYRTAARYAWPESDQRVIDAFSAMARPPVYGVPLTEARLRESRRVDATAEHP